MTTKTLCVHCEGWSCERCRNQVLEKAGGDQGLSEIEIEVQQLRARVRELEENTRGLAKRHREELDRCARESGATFGELDKFKADAVAFLTERNSLKGDLAAAKTQHQRELAEIQLVVFGLVRWGFDPNTASADEVKRGLAEVWTQLDAARADKTLDEWRTRALEAEAEVSHLEDSVIRRGGQAGTLINLLRGAPPEGCSWSTHDLVDVAHDVVIERDWLLAATLDLADFADTVIDSDGEVRRFTHSLVSAVEERIKARGTW
jgi:hypothetical protein